MNVTFGPNLPKRNPTLKDANISAKPAIVKFKNSLPGTYLRKMLMIM
jgi:hypothetical protein